jgi:FMN phosphatase YigB (HAD superfamily)
MHYLNRITLLVALCAVATYANISAAAARRVFIATDLNKVLIKKDNWKILKTVAHKPKKINDARKFKKDTGMIWGEELYIQSQTGGHHAIANTIKDLCMSQRVSRSVLKIYKKLHAQGVEFYYATNNGTIFMAELKKKFSELFNPSFIKDGVCVDYAAQDVIKKPDHRYYELLVKLINPAENDLIIFIDDELENCNAARAWATANNVNMLVIHFQGASQLKDIVRALKFKI